MDRRSFVKVLGATTAVVAINPSLIGGTLYGEDGVLYKTYEKVKLVDKTGKAITIDALQKEVNYVFNYPHVSTPCFLLNLPTPSAKEVKLKSEDGIEYVWSGGIGKNSSVVAFSGICAHALTHPNPDDSFVKYVASSEKTIAHPTGGVIVCSSHMSVYDPKQGAKNLAGEAKQPLANIVLEEGADGAIYAVGVLGAEMFQMFFKAFKPELKQRYGGPAEAKKLASIEAKTVVLSEYTKEIIAY